MQSAKGKIAMSVGTEREIALDEFVRKIACLAAHGFD
jgi:hypothetical protein